MNKKVKYGMIALGSAILIYLAFTYKRAYIDKGYGNDSTEKSILIDKILILNNLPDTDQNRARFEKMSISELEKMLK
jgi:hypothetical protein